MRQVYLLVHVTFPTQVDGDPVEYVHPVAVYTDKQHAELICVERNAEDTETPEGDYAQPYYGVYPLDLHTLDRDE